MHLYWAYKAQLNIIYWIPVGCKNSSSMMRTLIDLSRIKLNRKNCIYKFSSRIFFHSNAISNPDNGIAYPVATCSLSVL